MVLQVRASDAHCAIGRPAKKTDGLVAAETNGTRSILGVFVQPVCTSGLRPSVFCAADGRCIPIGMRLREK